MTPAAVIRAWFFSGRRQRRRLQGEYAGRLQEEYAGPHQRRRLQLRVRKHLRRLERIWIQDPIYFVTTCTYQRKQILACQEIADILIKEWKSARHRHGWAIGQYVVMPNHVHFFCSPELDAKALPTFVGSWKEWTSKAIKHQLRLTTPVWQEEFFDHVLRSSESYSEK